MSATDNGGGSSEELFSTEETLIAMKLTSQEERLLFEEVLSWWEAKNLRLSIQIMPMVGASLLTRLLLCTAKCVESTSNNVPPMSPRDELNISTSRDAKQKSLVTPEEDGLTCDVSSSKETNAAVTSTKPSSSRSSQGSSTHQNSVNDASCLQGFKNLASDFAKLLAASAKQVEPSKLALPTVAYVASAYCLMLKSNKGRNTPTLVASELVRVWKEDATDEDILAYSSLFEKALLGVSHAAKSSVESYSDFEYMWSSCTSNSQFREAISTAQDSFRNDSIQVETDENEKRLDDALSDQEQQLRSLKKLCWILSCLVDEQESSDGGSLSGRRQRILNTGACLGLVLSLSILEVPLTDHQLEQAKDSSTGQNDSDDKTLFRASKKPSRTDVVDALSLMVKGRSVETPVHHFMPPTLKNPIEVITTTMNNLLGTIQPSFLAIATPISSQDLENTVMKVAQLVMPSSSFFHSPGAVVTSNPPSLENDSRDAAMKDAFDAPPDTSSLLLSLRTLLPTRAHRAHIMDATFIGDALFATVQKSVDVLANSNFNSEVSFGRFPFVDKPNLGSDNAAVVPFLCMTSSKASGGVAMICRYDANDMVSSQGTSVAVEPSLTSDDSEGGSMRETLELNEWTASILAISDVRPSTRLMVYLNASDHKILKRKRKRASDVTEKETAFVGWKEVIATLLDRALGRLIDDSNSPQGGTDKTKGRLSVSDKDGSIIVDGDENDIEIRLCKALVAMYYQALEAILYHETARLKSASHPKLIMSVNFHRAALTCCCICLVKALCSSSALALSEKFLDLDLPCIQQIMECCPYTFLKVSESFARAFKVYKMSNQGVRSTQMLGLPRVLHRELSRCEVIVIDSLLWSQEPNYSVDLSVMDIVVDIKNAGDKKRGQAWPPEVLLPTLPEEIDDVKDENTDAISPQSGSRPPDHLYFSYVIRKLLKIAFFRISALCMGLSIPPEYPVASQVWIAFRYLLRNNIEILYDRHVDQLILCTLYGVCKMMKVEPELTFSRTIEVYSIVRGTELGSRACHRLTRHIRLRSDIESSFQPGSGKRKSGNIIQFYNTIIVPALKSHLLQSHSLKKASAQLRECMADPNFATKTSKHSFVNGCDQALAARCDNLASDSGNWAADPTNVAVKKGNVQMNVLIPSVTNTMDSKTDTKKEVPKGKSKSFSHENQSFFTFGGTSTQNVNLMNQVAAEV